MAWTECFINPEGILEMFRFITTYGKRDSDEEYETVDSDEEYETVDADDEVDPEVKEGEIV